VIAKVQIVRAMLAVLSLALAAPDVAAQGQPKPAPEDQTDLNVGEKAPKFTLKDQQGKERSLDELLKKGKVALASHSSQIRKARQSRHFTSATRPLAARPRACPTRVLSSSTRRV
jgi:hypothetical protein